MLNLKGCWLSAPLLFLALIVFFLIISVCSSAFAAAASSKNDHLFFDCTISLTSDDLPLSLTTGLFSSDPSLTLQTLTALPPPRGQYTWLVASVKQNSTLVRAGDWERGRLYVTQGTAVISGETVAFLKAQDIGTPGVYSLVANIQYYTYQADRVQGSFGWIRPFPGRFALAADSIKGLSVDTHHLSGTGWVYGPGDVAVYAGLYSRTSQQEPASVTGEGYNLDAALALQFTPGFTGRLEVEHLLGEIHWHHIPYTDSYLNTDAWDGIDGNYGPLLHGWVGNEDWVQRLEPCVSGELRLNPHGTPWSLALTWHQWEEEPGLKIAWHPNQLLTMEAGAALTASENYPLYSLVSNLKWRALHLSFFAAGYNQVITGAGLSAAYTLSW